MKKTEIADQVDAVLRPLGFVRSHHTWNRRVGEFVDVVDIQYARTRAAFTANVGILATEIFVVFEEADIPTIAEEPQCTVRARVGSLVNGRDKWWPLVGDGSIEELSVLLTNYAIPFCNSMHSIEAMKQWLVGENVVGKKYPPPIIYLAIAEAALGNLREACLLLSELKGRSVGSWIQRVDKVRSRLKCG